MNHSAPALLRSATPVRERAFFPTTAMNTLRKKLALATLSVVLGVSSAQAVLVTAFESITDRDPSDTARSLFRTTTDGVTTWRAGEATILSENQLSSNWGLSTGNMVTWQLTDGYFTNNFTGGSITGFLSNGTMNVSVTPWSGENFQIYSSRLTLSYDTSPLAGALPDGSDGSGGSLVGPGGIAGVPESNSTLLLVAGASVLLWRFARRKTSGVGKEKLS